MIISTVYKCLKKNKNPRSYIEKKMYFIFSFSSCYSIDYCCLRIILYWFTFGLFVFPNSGGGDNDLAGSIVSKTAGTRERDNGSFCLEKFIGVAFPRIKHVKIARNRQISGYCCPYIIVRKISSKFWTARYFLAAATTSFN